MRVRFAYIPEWLQTRFSISPLFLSLDDCVLLARRQLCRGYRW